MTYRLTVNERQIEADVPGLMPLAFVLRNTLGLTGTKVGCREGRCGACTVSLDGRAVASCLYPVACAAGKRVTTVEGLAPSANELHPLQTALLQTGAVQCGICTPGILMTLVTYLDEHATPDETALRRALAGNLCRCTGYAKIVEAALSIARAPA